MLVLYLCLLSVLIFIFPVSVLPLAVYLVLVLVFSLSISAARKEIAILPFCAFTFIVSHIGYGAGYLKGCGELFIRKNPTAESCARRWQGERNMKTHNVFWTGGVTPPAVLRKYSQTAGAWSVLFMLYIRPENHSPRNYLSCPGCERC